MNHLQSNLSLREHKIEKISYRKFIDFSKEISIKDGKLNLEITGETQSQHEQVEESLKKFDIT